MGDGKSTSLFAGVAFFLMLPLLIVLAMLMTSLGSVGNAAQCTPTETGKAFAYPTDDHSASADWDDDGEEQHLGIDYDPGEGKPVYAAADGKVVDVTGDWVKIQHDEGVQTWYKFLETPRIVHVNEPVTRAQKIGTVGSGDEDEPGDSGAHLHFELRVKKNGDNLESVDPTDEIGEDPPPASGCGCGTGTGGPLVGSNNEQKAFNFFVQNGYTPEQAAGVVGNMIHESQVEPTLKNGDNPGTVTHPAEALAAGRKAWGIVQWYPASKMIQPSRDAGVDDATIETLEFQLEFLKKQLDGTGAVPLKPVGDELKATRTVEEAAFVFAFKFEIFTTDPNDPEFDDRKATAREVLATYGDGAASAAGGPGACAAGNGDIVATAVGLAWHSPNRHDGVAKTLATDAYQKMMPVHNGTDDNDQNPYTDCGVFVATVMRMSGADPDYPIRGTSTQEPYLRNSGKYDVFDNLTSIEQLRPGDIMIGPGHTFLYIGPQEGDDGNTYAAASASWNEHPPEFVNAYIDDDGKHFAAARLKK